MNAHCPHFYYGWFGSVVKSTKTLNKTHNSTTTTANCAHNWLWLFATNTERVSFYLFFISLLFYFFGQPSLLAYWALSTVAFFYSCFSWFTNCREEWGRSLWCGDFLYNLCCLQLFLFAVDTLERTYTVGMTESWKLVLVFNNWVDLGTRKWKKRHKFEKCFKKYFVLAGVNVTMDYYWEFGFSFSTTRFTFNNFFFLRHFVTMDRLFWVLTFKAFF